MNQQSSFSVYNASAGSGKTFTLVKEYLKIVLSSESVYHFQKILAITFTNKAAAEMKERILENLRAFAEGDANDMRTLLAQELQVTPEVLTERSQRIVSCILQNYSAFNITTIDSFTHKLIRTFAYDLGLPLNFEVEMDASKLIGEAVDVLISKLGVDEELTNVLIAFSMQKVTEDKFWDITMELNSIAKLLLNEDDRLQFKRLEKHTLSDFVALADRLKKSKARIEKVFGDFLIRANRLIAGVGLGNEHLHIDFKSFLNRLNAFREKPEDLEKSLQPEARLRKSIDKGNLSASKASKSEKDSLSQVSSELIQVFYEVEKEYQHEVQPYLLMSMVEKNLIPLAVLNNIQKELTRIKTQNMLCLNAEFNQLISDKIKNEPAPFIYERIGEKFQHYFIDEMQDTSALQWQNLIPLIDNALSQEGGSLMLVGDAKQAIYRWRGGKAEQFIDLSQEGTSTSNNPFYIEKATNNLDTNYRSFSEVIGFNNAFFTHVSGFLSHPMYRDLYVTGNNQLTNSREGGYVQIDFVEIAKLKAEEALLLHAQKVLEIVLDLDSGFKRSDVCILVRKKKEGVLIANYLTENGVAIISSETLLLQNSLKVQFLIHLLRYIQNPLDTKSKFEVLVYVYQHLKISHSKHLYYKEFMSLSPKDFFKNFEGYGIYFDYDDFLQLPFYESVECVIRAFKLIQTSDAYVQFFLDFVLEFQAKNYNDLSVFLETWDQKKDSLSIAAAESEHAVRIMTIHKSKGLEFPIVVFPCDLDFTKEIDAKVWYDALDAEVFGDFDTALISCSSKIEFTGGKGKQLYEQRQQELALDNFNLLYVALTRAVEQLYLVTSLKLDKSGQEDLKYISGLYINYLKSLSDDMSWDANKHSYVLGSKERLSTIKKEESKVVTVLQDTFISSAWNSHNIEIVANSSKNWGTERAEAVRYGILLHEMLSKIISKEDIDAILNSYVLTGDITDEMLPELGVLLLRIVEHPSLQTYFHKNALVYTEREIIDFNKSILIPDRLVFDGDKVVIIDYKTGQKSDAHVKQIQSYAAVLTEMGYLVEKQLIVYIEPYIEILSV